MKKTILIISILLIAIIIKLGLHYNWLNSKPVSYATQEIAPTTAEEKILLGQKIDINQATVKELEVLTGIGPGLAKKIVANRTQFGPYKSVENLTRVPGIGSKTLLKFRRFIDAK